MLNIIISVLVAILVYLVLDYFKVKENLPAKNPANPEKCFYDYELIEMHDIFVNALKDDQDMLRKMKGRILPSVCILDLVLNRKTGWDKFLDSLVNKYGAGGKVGLVFYLTDMYNKALAGAKELGLSFLTEPYDVKIEKVDPTTGEKKIETKNINIMKEFQDIIIKKVAAAGDF